MSDKTTKITISSKGMLIIESTLLLIIGILFCCSISVNQMVNYCLGILLILCGIFTIVTCYIQKHTAFSAEGVSASGLISLGVFCFLVGFNFSAFIDLFLATAGALLLLDGVIGLISKRNTTAVIVELVLGAVMITLGLCLWLIPKFGTYSEVVMGVIFIVLGVFGLVFAFLPDSKKKNLSK
jgi:hypothetical protein